MFYSRSRLPHRQKPKTDIYPKNQSYNVDSPNEMVVDTDEYVGVVNAPEKDSVAIINPDGPEQGDSDQQLQDLPLANDCTLPLDRTLPA
jgi:ubiquitin carboxyl-terminal hydrolase 7